jgi:hypothetical protein
MSPKTVESVIGRIYRKLGVGSRAQLATLLAARNVWLLQFTKRSHAALQRQWVEEQERSTSLPRLSRPGAREGATQDARLAGRTRGAG